MHCEDPCWSRNCRHRDRLRETSSGRSNLFVLRVLQALLLDCRIPCDWTNSTTTSRASKLRSVPWSVAKHRDCCSWIASQELSKIACSRSFPVSCEGTNSWFSTMRESSPPACLEDVPGLIRTLLRGPQKQNT